MTAEDVRPAVYKMGFMRRYLLWYVMSPLLIFASIPTLSPEPQSRLLGAGLIVLVLLLTAALHWTYFRTRLELSPGGVRLIDVIGGIETTWPNVIGLRLDRGKEAFITQAPLHGKGADRLVFLAEQTTEEGTPIYDDEQRSLMAQRRLIPIVAFAHHFRRGTLGAEVARLAPHLRAVVEAGPPPAPRKDLQERFFTCLGLVALYGFLAWAVYHVFV